MFINQFAIYFLRLLYEASNENPKLFDQLTRGTSVTQQVLKNLVDFPIVSLSKQAGFKSSQDIDCLFCTQALDVLKQLAFEYYSVECGIRYKRQISELINCTSTQEICEDIKEIYQTYIFYVLRFTNVTNEQICNEIFDCAGSDNFTPNVLNWSINIPAPTSALPPPLSNNSNQRVLHLSDLSVEEKYQECAPAECVEQTCCRSDSTSNMTNPKQAGKWGAYTCDLPPKTLENMLSQIARDEQFDFIYLAMNAQSNALWDQSRTTTLSYFEFVHCQLEFYFPQKKIFVTMGSLDTFPKFLFPTQFGPIVSMSWLYEPLADQWIGKFGVPEDQRSNINTAGYYTLLLAQGIRLVSLNTNFCNPNNLFLFTNPFDSWGQLRWLRDILVESEISGEKVHIIGHLPPSQCMFSWSRNYYRLVQRFSSNIVGQFFGATHHDEIRIFYDESNVQPINVLYVTPSVTTWLGTNPSYRIYDINGQTWKVDDYVTKSMNLTEANRLNSPKYELGYGPLDEYDIGALTPLNLNALISYVNTFPNSQLADLLIKNYYASSPLADECQSETCRKKIFCDFKNAQRDRIINC